MGKFLGDMKMYSYLTKALPLASSLALLLGIVGVASADEIHVVGSTVGRFNSQAFGSTNSLLNLTYDNSTFDNTTVVGALDLGGDPIPGSNVNNLGSFTLGFANGTYSGNSFQLKVTFTAPVTIVGGTTATFTDLLTGTVSGGLGGVFIDFDNTPQTFFFSNGAASGSFTMFVNDVSIAPGNAASLTGRITGSQSPVPEPTALVGLGCGLLGIFGLRRKH